jgi:hypothetical protein
VQPTVWLSKVPSLLSDHCNNPACLKDCQVASAKARDSLGLRSVLVVFQVSVATCHAWLEVGIDAGQGNMMIAIKLVLGT